MKPQMSCLDKCKMDTQYEVPKLGSVELSPTDTRWLYHGVIDIPEPDMTPTMTDPVPIPSEPEVSRENVDYVATESVSLRHSGRERCPPRKFTHDELGEPLTLAIGYFFQALGVAFSSAVMSPSQWPR